MRQEVTDKDGRGRNLRRACLGEDDGGIGEGGAGAMVWSLNIRKWGRMYVENETHIQPSCLCLWFRQASEPEELIGPSETMT